MTQSAEFVTKLHQDKEYRKFFCKNPKDALAKYGIDVDALVLPERIDEEQLMDRLDALFKGERAFEPATDIEPNLSAQELWDRFGAFGWAEDIRANDKKQLVIGTAAALVIYGTSVAVSTSVIYGTTATTTIVGGNDKLEFERASVFSIDHVKELRELQGMPLEDIRFNLHTNEGKVINSLPADLVLAFLERAKRAQ